MAPISCIGPRWGIRLRASSSIYRDRQNGGPRQVQDQGRWVLVAMRASKGTAYRTGLFDRISQSATGAVGSVWTGSLTGLP